MVPFSDSCSQRFQGLLLEHARIVLHVARIYAPHAVDRRDLIQEIHAQLWRAFPSYDSSRSFSTWMYRVALNVGISWLRQESGRRALFENSDETSLELLAADTTDSLGAAQLRELQAMIAGLDPLNRALILLYLDDRPYGEIADILGLSETNVATKISRIKQRLREQAQAAERIS